MTVEIFDNLKASAKEVWGAGLAIYKIVGEEYAAALWKEFEVLVRQTAQYTGSTAASWNIDVAQVPADGRVRVRGLGPDEDPFWAGHSAAVNLALSANKANLNDLYRKTRTFGINVWNDAPGITEGVADTGPFRDINYREGAEEENFAKFQQRVQEKVIEPFRGVVDVTEIKRIAASL